MAATYVPGADDTAYAAAEPGVFNAKALRRSLSSMSSASSSSASSGDAPRCVCAPPTHARSFKCRLHRNNSIHHAANGHGHGHGHGHAHHHAAPVVQQPQQPSQ